MVKERRKRERERQSLIAPMQLLPNRLSDQLQRRFIDELKIKSTHPAIWDKEHLRLVCFRLISHVSTFIQLLPHPTPPSLTSSFLLKELIRTLVSIYIPILLTCGSTREFHDPRNSGVCHSGSGNCFYVSAVPCWTNCTYPWLWLMSERLCRGKTCPYSPTTFKVVNLKRTLLCSTKKLTSWVIMWGSMLWLSGIRRLTKCMLTRVTSTSWFLIHQGKVHNLLTYGQLWSLRHANVLLLRSCISQPQRTSPRWCCYKHPLTLILPISIDCFIRAAIPFHVFAFSQHCRTLLQNFKLTSLLCS